MEVEEAHAPEVPAASILRSPTKKKEGSPRAMKTSAITRASPRVHPTQSGLKAGISDDNQQFNYFLNFLEKYKQQAPHYPINISERIILKVVDSQGRSIANATVQIDADSKQLEKGLSYSDGSYLFFPSEYDAEFQTFKVSVTNSFQQGTTRTLIQRQGKRNISIPIDNLQLPTVKKIPMDILFIFDTTGSMGEEIERLKQTIEVIHLNLTSQFSQVQVDLRFGMVLYKDREDRYITKLVPFTSDLEAFQKELEQVTAGGGGDSPEDLQAALKEAFTKMKWNPRGVKAGFIITDASPHLDYQQDYTYVQAASDAKQNAIKLFSIGTGGLDIKGEYVLRQISQYTGGKYIFLTYGEKGESEGGRAGSVSHHSGSNYQTDKLEAIIIRLMKDEISNYTGATIKMDEDFFQANKIEDEDNQKTLQTLFGRALSQLFDYSTVRLTRATPVAVLPIGTKNKSLTANAEYFTKDLILTVSQNVQIKLLERIDVQKIEEEIDCSCTTKPTMVMKQNLN